MRPARRAMPIPTSSFDTRSNQLVQVSADIILLDRVLARYGPETKEARAVLQRSTAAVVERFWPTAGAKPIAVDAQASPVEALYEKIEELSPQGEAQHSLQAAPLSKRSGLCKGLSRVRWEINSEVDQLLAGLLQVSGAP